MTGVTGESAARPAAPAAGRVLAQSATTAVAYRVLNVASGFITLPLLVASMSQRDFGIWIVMSQSVSLLALSDLGAGNAIGRFVARFRGLGDRESLSRVLSTVLAILLAAALVVTVVTWVLAPHVPAWVGVEPDQHPVAVQVFLIIGFGIAAQLPLRLALGVLIGHQLYGPHAVGKIAESLLSFAGIVALWSAGGLTLLSLALVTAAASVLAQCILLLVAWRMTGPWGMSVARVTRPMAADLFGMGGSVLIMTAASMLYTQGTGLVAGALLGVTSAAVYGVALTVVGNLHPLITSISIPLATLSSEWQARKDTEQLRRTSLLVMRLTFATGACVAAGLVMFGEPAVRLWLHRSDWSSSDFTEAGRALAIMGVCLAIGLPHIGSRSTLQGVGRHWLVGVTVLGASVVSVIAGAAAMRAGWGIAGAALGWGLVWAIQGTVLFPPLIARYLQEPLPRMIRYVYLPGAVLCGLVFAAGLGTTRFVEPATASGHLLAAVPAMAVAAVGLVAIAPRAWMSKLVPRRA